MTSAAITTITAVAAGTGGFVINGAADDGAGAAVAGLGDVNGDRKVDTTDSSLTLSAFGTTNPERDVNGDGFVNANDRTLVLRGLGRKLKESLLLND